MPDGPLRAAQASSARLQLRPMAAVTLPGLILTPLALWYFGCQCVEQLLVSFGSAAICNEGLGGDGLLYVPALDIQPVMSPAKDLQEDSLVQMRLRPMQC